ncbi:MAG: radical SAM protein [Planctomycetota bacterium]
MDRAAFVIRDFQPAYLAPDVRRTLPDRVRRAQDELRNCRACPRACAVDRTAGQLGYCGVGRQARVASAFPHFGEESCLVGTRGSGTIFFSGCNLHCVFCQNWDISQRRAGQEVSAAQLADLMLTLQAEGCHNVNLVTPEHVVPQVIEALAAAIDGGLRVPVVYNTSAYDSLESLRLLDGLIDIYMPDFKFWESETAARLAHAADYPDRARDALREMHRQVGILRLTPDGLAARGVLVRHLVMPGLVHESAAIFRWLAGELSPDTFVNIMGQYHPANEVTAAPAGRQAGRSPALYTELQRRPTAAEFAAAHAAACAAGLWRFDA